VLKTNFIGEAEVPEVSLVGEAIVSTKNFIGDYVARVS
jgi:hypothetical protein